MRSIIKLQMVAIVMLATLYAKAKEATVTVEVAGGLKAAIEAVNVSPITSLTIIGQLNAADIITLREREGNISTLNELDIKDVVFISSDKPYLDSGTMVSDAVWYTHRVRYFISNERTHKKWASGLSQNATNYDDYYDYNLAGAFQGMPLTRVVLPSSINEIGREEFKGCEYLTEIVMSNSPVFVGESACSGCTRLKTLPSLAMVTGMEERAFKNCAQLSFDELTKTANLQQLDSIPMEAFYGCNSMEKVLLSPSLRYVDQGAFQQSGLTAVTLPNGITEYGSAAFGDCSMLDDVQMPDNLYEIPYDLVQNTPYYTHPNRLTGNIRYVGKIATAIEGESEELIFKPGTVGVADNFNGNTENKVNALPRTVSLPESLHYIGDFAFIKAPLEKVSLPLGLLRIGKYAFAQCALTEVSMPDGLVELGDHAFEDNKQLYNVQIGKGLRSISVGAFYGCSAIEELVIPDNIENIESGAFLDCTNIRKLYFGMGVKNMGNNIFNTKNLEILDYQAESLPSIIFLDYSKLEQLTIGPHVKELYTSRCTNLKTVFFNAEELKTTDLFLRTSVENVVFGPDVRIIPDRTFQYCSKIKEITLPDGLLTLGTAAFMDCSSLQKLIVGKALKNVGSLPFFGSGLQEVYYNATDANASIFGGCNALTQIIIGPDVQSVPSIQQLPSLRYLSIGKSVKHILSIRSCEKLEEIFYNVENLDKELYSTPFSELPSFKKVVFGPDVKVIPPYCFSGCEKLESFDFPKNITRIGESAFSNCLSIREFAPNEGLEDIGDRAFYNCTSLSEITLPGTITNLGSLAFDRCENLLSVRSNIMQPTEITRVFTNETYYNGTLYVPVGTSNLYRNIWSWSSFSNIVEDEGLSVEGLTKDTTKPSFYLLNGTQSNGQRGVNIVRYDDGTVKKVLIK